MGTLQPGIVVNACADVIPAALFGAKNPATASIELESQNDPAKPETRHDFSINRSARAEAAAAALHHSLLAHLDATRR